MSSAAGATTARITDLEGSMAGLDLKPRANEAPAVRPMPRPLAPLAQPAKLPLRVKSITWETDKIKVYDLRADGGSRLPAFTAGAHIDLDLRPGLSRSYSLLNSPAESHRYVIGVALDANSRGGSRFVHDELRPGMMLNVTAPENNFILAEDAPHSVLIAGGIGITPLISMVHRLEMLRASWELHYCVRQRCEAAFLDTLVPYGQRLHLYCLDEDRDHLDIAGLLGRTGEGRHFYCCGPGGMLDAYRAAAAPFPPERVHFEYFAPKEDAALSGGFTVELARAGLSVTVPPGHSILESLLQAGVAVPHSCQEGVCGTCETRVLAGEPDHRDSVLSDAERRSGTVMMICCSGSKSERLVLDL